MKLMMNQKHQKKDTCLHKKRQQIIDELRLAYNNIITEYQKITNLLDNASSQPSKFRTKHWVEINAGLKIFFFSCRT